MNRLSRMLCLLLGALLLLACAPTAQNETAIQAAAETRAPIASETAAPVTEPTETNEATEKAAPAIERLAAYTPADDSPALLQSAKWIWTGNTENNVWVELQKTFTLDAVPESAVCEIAVENKYRLWVNDTLVVYDGGLKRGYSETDGYFDRIDLAPYLTAGENEIRVSAWFWGVKEQSYSNIPVDTAGFLFALDLGNESLVSDETWLAARDLAYKDDNLPEYSVPQPNFRLPEYNIYYDASDADKLTFAPASVRGAYGDAPWNALHLRPIPMFIEYGLTDYENGADYTDYTTTDAEAITVRAAYNAQLAPYLEIAAHAGDVITVTTENTEHGEYSVRATYVAADGYQSFEAPAWMSGQFVTYTMPAGVTVHRLAYRESGYDTKLAGTFEMGDDFFDTLWQMGARTQYVCIRDGFMDCPDRERAGWTGDATTQMRQLLYCLDPNAYALYQKMLAQKVAFTTTGGKGGKNDLLPTVAPIFNEFYELPAQEMAGIIGVWDYYLYTGDGSAIYTMYEPSLRYLKLWKLNKDGLVKHKTGQGLVDWQDTGTNKVDTKVQENALYYWALSSVRNMALALGEDTAEIDERLAAIREGYEALWVDGIGYTTTGTPDDRANAFAVLAGLVPEQRYETVRTALVNNEKASTYTEAYVEMALCRMGYVSDALDRMQKRYTGMVETNLQKGMTTLWEYFEEGMGTYNHAWSASPVYTLSAYVGGIRPTSAGYRTYLIAPDFSHSDTVSVTVASVLGTIAVEANADGTMQLVLPEGGEASVRVPNAAGKTVYVNGNAADSTPDGVFAWVTITEAGSVTITVQ